MANTDLVISCTAVDNPILCERRIKTRIGSIGTNIVDPPSWAVSYEGTQGFNTVLRKLSISKTGTSNPARLPNPSMERQHSHPGELERNRFSHHHSDHPLVISTALEAADSKIASLRLGSIARTAQAAPRMRTGSTISIVELRISVALHFGTTTNHFRLRLAMKRI